jgi:hypothetical protein
MSKTSSKKEISAEIRDLKRRERYDNDPFFKKKKERAIESHKRNPIPRDLLKLK